MAMLKQFTRIATPISTQGTRAFGRWAHVKMGPKDPILGVTEAYKASTHPDKISVGVGAYRDDEGKPVVLPSVKEAERRVVADNLDNEYLPIGGLAKFNDLALDLAYGASRPQHIVALQALSGTGSLRLLAQYIVRNWDGELPTIYISDPSWGNHFPIFEHAGLKTKKYTYYDPATVGLNFEGMMADVNAAPDNSVFLLHATAHNPTGIDPTMDQWKQISDVMKAKNHFVAFDMAYQGFASGSCDKDAEGFRYFVDQGHKVCLMQSMAKNFGLYGQRTGCFSLVCSDADEAARVESQVKIVARAIWSSPPLHGARVCQYILQDEKLKQQWFDEVKGMADRIISMRHALKDGLKEAGSTKNWDHVTSQIGMFCYSGMTGEMVDKLAQEHAIFMTRNGRISMAGVTSKNVKRIAACMHEVTKDSN